MTRDHSRWLLAAPLVAAAALVVHSLAYRLAGSDPQIAAHDSAHHYLSHLPLLALPAGLLVVAALSLRLVRARSGSTGGTLPGVPVAAGALVVFAAQEWLERLAHTGRADLALADELPFRLGLVLAVPVALAALAAGRSLLRSADAIARAGGSPAVFVPSPRPSAEPSPTARACPAPLRVPSRPTGRAPPLLLAA